LRQALELARRACDAAHQGDGVVITTATDTLEEFAVSAPSCTTWR
jgi:L-asparaginase/Glu-tRNA(Gln) amidotransferase subunit D